MKAQTTGIFRGIFRGIFVFTCLVVFASLTACKKDDEGKGQSLGMPLVEPPVERNAPSGMLSSTVGLAASNSDPLEVLASRFFTIGPTSIMERLAMIDTRMAELNTRSEGSEEPPACLSAEATLWDQPAARPGGASFPIYLQCQEEMSPAPNALKMAFGVDDDYAYLVEIQTHDGSATSPKMATLVRAKKDGSGTEAWITMQSFDTSQTANAEDFFFLAIAADDKTKGFEVSVGGSGQGIGVDCGVRIRSDGTNVYATGVFASFGDRNVEDCSGTGTGSDTTGMPSVELCLDASNLKAVDADKCTDIDTFELPSLTHSGLEANGKTVSDEFVEGEFGEIGTFGVGG